MKKIILIFLFLLIFASFAENSSINTKKDKSTIQLLFKALRLINYNYVDSEKVTYDKLVRSALKGIMSDLDKNSIVEEKEMIKKTTEKRESKFTGIGVLINQENNKLTILSVYKNSPAFKAGIKVNDQIIKIEGEEILPNDFKGSLKKLKGSIGTTVNVTIYRPAEKITKDIAIVRNVVKVSPVQGSNIIKGNVGYIKITDFNLLTYKHLVEKIKEFKNKNVEALILDLRWNPGGLLESAIKISQLFLAEKKQIVFVKGASYETIDYKSKRGNKFLDIPILIIVNNLTASAAEIVTAALKENNRATIFGEQTFGKGSVQTYVKLSSDIALRFTIAKYYSPNHNEIDKKGVTPDILFSDKEKELTRILYTQSTKYPGIIKPKVEGTIEDIQLKRAVNTLKGMLIKF